MLRAAAWTGGLFAVGGSLCQVFPQAWLEPVVLMALGAALLVVSSRSGAGGASAGGRARGFEAGSVSDDDDPSSAAHAS